MTTLPRQLLSAYLRTSFGVWTPDGEIILRCGHSSPDIDRLLERAGVSSWAYVTAYNPASRRLSAEENRARHDGLVAEVSSRFSVLHGEGVGDDGDWPAEPSVLVLGMGREEAARVGSQYGQNAVLVGALHEPAELLVCTPDPAGAQASEETA